jgi:chaperonin GroEL (HSP60 family)
MEVIPTTLAENAGLNSIKVVTESQLNRASADQQGLENVLLCDIILHTTAANADTSIVAVNALGGR